MVTKTAAIAEQRVVLHGVSWETYESLLSDDESRRAPRMTYDQGELEIMSPSPDHERWISVIVELVELILDVRDVNYEQLGSTTFRSQEQRRGFEADACFYIQHYREGRRLSRIDLKSDPAPDLVVEIDISRSSRNKRQLFADLGVREYWRHDGTRTAILVRTDGEFVERLESGAIPGLTADVLNELIGAYEELDKIPWRRKVQAWARANPPE